MNVSTSPVVTVTSRIHSFSRWSVAECPWTPTLATRPSGADELGAELERLRNADCLDCDVGSEPVGQLQDPVEGTLGAVVDRHVRAEGERLLEARVGEVDRDDTAGGEELRGHDRGEPDRACADDRDRVAGLHAAVQHPDLVGGREDVGQEQHLLVAQRLGDRVHGRVPEGHACVVGLEAVDQVAQDPAAAARAQAVVALAAEPAASARP